jgi:UDP-GlcNAc:undecaprenyl-phosphate/decaprenyl-phosphate GlcNAc-1-phosphate transferase
MTNNIVIYVISSFLILITVSKISYHLNLLDVPDKRKKHLNPTAYTGGLGISFIYLFSIFLFDVEGEKVNLILTSAFLISIVGFIDDKYNLNIGGKLSLQLIPIIYLILIEKFKLNEIGDYNYFKLQLNSLSVPFTLLSSILLINAFNYFDGLDGTLSFASISVLIILYFLTSDENMKLLLITILLPLLIFLFFNFSILKLPKLFLGDCGSLLLGFIISFLLIYYSNQKLVHPILLAWSITIFVYEFISINLIRLIKKKALFKAQNDHLHHILINKSKSIFLTNLSIFITNIVLFTIGYVVFKLINPFTSLVLFILCFVFFFILRKKYSIKN